MQNRIDTFPRKRSGLRRNVNKAKFYSAAHKIDNQRPFEIAVAISTDHRHGPAGRAQLIEDPFRTNIAEMPDFIRVVRKIDNALWQLVVRVGEHEDAYHDDVAETPSTKHQTPGKLQAPIFKTRSERLVIESWSFPGIWCLGFGALTLCASGARPLASVRVI